MARPWGLTSVGSGPGSRGFLLAFLGNLLDPWRSPALSWQKGMRVQTSWCGSENYTGCSVWPGILGAGHYSVINDNVVAAASLLSL